MYKITVIFFFGLVSNYVLSQEINWKDRHGADSKNSSTLKIIAPFVGSNSFWIPRIRLYVDIFDAESGRPEIPKNFSPLPGIFSQANARKSGRYLGTVRFDHDKNQRELTVNLPTGKPYFFYIQYYQIDGLMHYVCHGISEEALIIENGTEYVLKTDFRRFKVLTPTCSAKLTTKAEFELNNPLHREASGIGNLSRLELNMLYGDTWLAILAAQRIIYNRDYEDHYLVSAANRLWSQIDTNNKDELNALNHMAKLIGEARSEKYKPFLEMVLTKLTRKETKKLAGYVKKAIKKSSVKSDQEFTPTTITAIEGYDLNTLAGAALTESLINGTTWELQGAGMQLVVVNKNRTKS